MSFQTCESPVWLADRREVVCVDIDAGTLHVAEDVSATTREVFEVVPTRSFSPQCGYQCGRIGAVVPCETTDELLLVCDVGIVLYNLKTQKTQTLLAVKLPSDLRFNDAKCDPSGKLWCGTISLSRTRGAASLFRLDHNPWRLTEVVTGLTNSNGLAWSSDGATLYHIDTPTREVVAYDVTSQAGDIKRRGVVVKFDNDTRGRPDGMTIDEDGMLWIAHYEGGCVSQWNPQNGERLAVVPLPHDRVTSCTFGGGDLQTLFVTVADVGMFACRVQSRGVEPSRVVIPR
ncbi:MAG: SMP-30/gluconolactonase/LRE family protein [Thermoguttaceae bacterium]